MLVYRKSQGSEQCRGPKVGPNVAQIGALEKSGVLEGRFVALKIHTAKGQLQYSHDGGVRGALHANGHRMMDVLGSRKGERVHAPVLRHDRLCHAV